MSKLTILLNKSFDERYVGDIAKIAPDAEILHAGTDDLSDEQLAEVDIILGWLRDNAKRIKNLPEPKLSWIQTISAGVDSVDQEWLSKNKITLTTASGVHGIPIRESIFAMLLGINRGIVHAVKQQAKSNWNADVSPWLLQGKTMMIFGTGAIGKSTAELGKKGFDMKIIGVNTSGRQVEWIDEIVTVDHALERVGEADIVVDILPLTDRSRGYFNRRFFERMKDGSVFVNVGRGPSVVTDDLISALRNGRPAYAALDVTDPEPLPEDNPLWTMDQVLIAPHISGGTPDYMDRLMEIIKENLTSYIKEGKPNKNVVHYDRGY